VIFTEYGDELPPGRLHAFFRQRSVQRTDPLRTKQLVLLGGGHSHVEVLRRFGKDPPPDSQLVLISPDPDSPYSGMLPGWIAGHYTRDDCHIDLTALAHFANCRLVQTACAGIDLDAGLVLCANGMRLPYDVLSIDAGGRSPASDTPGAKEHALSVRPIDDFVPHWEDICDRTVRGQAPRRLAVVGGGAAGVEVLLAMQYRLRQLAPRTQVSFELVCDAGSILLSHHESVRAIFMRVLEQRGVILHLAARAERVERGVVRLSGGASVAADAIVWATGASAPLWPKSSGLATDDGGFVRVNRLLQSVSHPQVFAAGDIASIAGEPRPKSGVYAVRAGPPLANNLRRMLRGERLVEWMPQKHALALITTGDRYAVASRGNFVLAGKWVWRWKNWIDRRFMQRYRNP